MFEKSTLYIVNDIEKSRDEILQPLSKHSLRIIENEEEGKSEFQIKQAQKTIKEAYIASSSTKYIVLCGSAFRIEAQNALLKVLEEPPKNIIFLIFTISKNSILPTIISRVQVKYLKTKKYIDEFSLDLSRLDLKNTYSFIKQHQRVSKSEAKEIIESILYSANKNNIKLNQKQLDILSRSMKLLELNSRPLNVLTTILLSLTIKR
ncbi:MAG: DNA polymerase III subunit delta' [Campylobacterota bacterium]|nr:DNA polymerase III subunit delta' [Campylobacterota bacterium]